MTKLQEVMKRLAQANITITIEEKDKQDTNKINQDNTIETSKAQQAMAQQAIEDTTELEDTQELIFDKFKPITNFFDSLDGATRLMKTYAKWEGVRRGTPLLLQEQDRDDLIMEVYTAIIQYEQQETDELLDENMQKYFGIISKEQYKKGKAAFKKLLRKNHQQAPTPQFDQDFGKTESVSTTDELGQIELEQILRAILTPNQYLVITMELDGYTQEEIGETLKITQQAISKQKKKIKAILKVAFEVAD